jgi:A/G-specific adenine glycosylase
VLRLWSGLGYNRRAKYLYEAAKILSQSSVWTYDMLVSCKGIGPNTARAVMVYAYNKPEVFIETNIRTIIIFYFFSKSQDKVTDKQILETISGELDTKNARTWYWALMDLGSFIKQNHKNTLHIAQSHKKQTIFKGSKRQVRGQVLRLLGASKSLTIYDLSQAITDHRLTEVIADLEHESLISYKNNAYYLGT